MDPGNNNFKVQNYDIYVCITDHTPQCLEHTRYVIDVCGMDKPSISGHG
jgi:hypothetical protein